MANERITRHQIGLVMTDTVMPGLTYGDIHRIYAESEYGQHHATQPLRYDQRYGYDPDQMLADLGDDVHPVRHMRYTDQAIARPFLSAQIWDGNEWLGFDDIRAVRMAATTHDMGETMHPSLPELVGPTPGDLHKDDKKAIHIAQERQIRQFLYAELYPDVPAELLDSAESIIDSHDTTLGQAFDAIERIGYYQTALRAGTLALELASQAAKQPERFSCLARLALNVTDNHHEILRDLSKTFPYVRTVLRNGRPIYDSTHIQLPAVLEQTVQNT